MKESIKKAEILVEALPYLQQFRRKTFIIKLGGSIMEDKSALKSVLRDAVLLENVGIRIIIIHGGGKAITKALKDKNIESEFIQGLRVTDKKAINTVEDVLVNNVNKSLVKIINDLGGRAVGFSAADHGVLEAKKKYVYTTEKGRQKRKDIGFVGNITKIYTHPIYRLLNAEKIPVIAPLALGPRGFVYNINADIASCEIAARLKAEKLIFITDVNGVYKGKKLLSSLTVKDVEDLINKNIIKQGMIPKTRGMIKALKKGVNKTHIINGNTKHSLLLEIYTDKGVGTELVNDK